MCICVRVSPFMVCRSPTGVYMKEMDTDTQILSQSTHGLFLFLCLSFSLPFPHGHAHNKTRHRHISNAAMLTKDTSLSASLSDSRLPDPDLTIQPGTSGGFHSRSRVFKLK
eukprot:Tamp_36070.p1 GENE.Tamp_36070~~Tamp_36070.p1  ORF type:complete len:111 (-),score=4.50 Tamp_36070:20-352(-)